ncbi:Thymus-specific serine protease [Entomophthora muscae]|uniref:Thymus-specific serine protease n=1 Tax=Entomophthora muscae TaxID=34485 RepID=A0ACC2T438_9FUNG|nr:Thymus-specific serine protease [Entomophthora muscae]
MHPFVLAIFWISLITCLFDNLGPFSLLKINEDELPVSTQEIYPEYYFSQIVDHYAREKTYYLQRYFVNDKYYRPGGPAFLFIGGESKISSTWVWWGQLAEAAKAHGGIIFALEHRYYGKSFPTKDLSVKNLKFLSSDQALKDLELFIKSAPLPRFKGSEDKFNVPSCWIVAGEAIQETLRLGQDTFSLTLYEGLLLLQHLSWPKKIFTNTTAKLPIH